MNIISKKSGIPSIPLDQKLIDIMQYLNTSYYISMDDRLKVRDAEFPAAIVFSLLNGLTNGKVLYRGLPGTGKTTLAEAAGAIAYDLTIDDVRKGVLHGHAEMTREEILGRPDLAALHRGLEAKEVVVWSNFAELPGPKIIDEMNRLPPGKQNLLLDIIANREMQYLKERKKQSEMSFYATVNFADAGTTPLVEPLRDRFDISVELMPQAGMVRMIRESAHRKDILQGDQRYAQNLFLTEDDRNAFRDQMKRVTETPEFYTFLDFISTETSFDPVLGVVRPNEGAPTSHYKDIFLKLSERSSGLRYSMNGAIDIMKGYAVLCGAKSLTPKLAMHLLPYSLGHRVPWNPTAISQAKEYAKDCNRKMPLDQLAAVMGVRDSYKNYMANQKEIELIEARMYEGKFDEAKAVLQKYRGVHPWFDCLSAKLETQALDPFTDH